MNSELHPQTERILVSAEEIKATTKRLASRINEDLNGEELLVIVILKGSMVFASDLIRELTMPVTLGFMRVSSYGASTASSGFIQIKQDLELKILKGKATLADAETEVRTSVLATVDIVDDDD